LAGLELFLVRHGQSLSNVEGRLCAEPPGPALTVRGWAQAQAAARLVEAGATGPVRIVTSPLLRAWQTAQALAGPLGDLPAILGGLRETAFGAWEGKTHRELRGEPAYRVWLRQPDSDAPPGVECVADAGGRVWRALTAIAVAGLTGSLAAYSHQHPILGFVRRSGLPAGEDEIPNAVVVRATWTGDGWRVRDIDPAAAAAGAPVPSARA